MKNQKFLIMAKAGRGIRLEPGMTLAIEPMVIARRNQTYFN